MWPVFVDSTDEQCKDALRNYELGAYTSVIAAFRAQGHLTSNKRRMLEELGVLFNISLERHKSEIRHALNDENLRTVSERLFGPNTVTEWALEGRRVLPLMQRLAPQTKYSECANVNATKQAEINVELPLPSKTGTTEIRGFETMACRKRRGYSVDSNILTPKIFAMDPNFLQGGTFEVPPMGEPSAISDFPMCAAEGCEDSPEIMSPVVPSSPFMMDFNTSKNLSPSFMSHCLPSSSKHSMPKTTSTVTTFSSFDQLSSNLLASRSASQNPAGYHEEQMSSFSDIMKPSSDLISAQRASHCTMKSSNNIVLPSSTSISSVCSSSLPKDRLQNLPCASSPSNKFLTQIRSNKNPSHTRQTPSGLGMSHINQRPQTMSPKSPIKTKPEGPSIFTKKSPNVFPPIPVNENSLSNDSSSSGSSFKDPTKSPVKQEMSINPSKTTGNNKQPQNIITKNPPSQKPTSNLTQQYNISRSLFSSSPTSTASKAAAPNKPVIFNVSSPSCTVPQPSSVKTTVVTPQSDGSKASQAALPKTTLPGMSSSVKLSTSTASTFQYRNSDGGIVRSARIVNISQPVSNRLPCSINPSTISALGLQTGMTSTTALRVTVPPGTINTSSSIRVSAAAKPNVIVVHKAQVWPRNQPGGAVIMSSAPVPKLPNDIAQEVVSISQKQDKTKPSGPKISTRSISNVRPMSPGVSIITDKAPATKAVVSKPSSSTTPRPTTEAHNSKPPENTTDVQCKKNLLADIMEASGILLENTARNKALKEKSNSVKNNKEMSNHDEIEFVGQKLSVSSSSESTSSRLSESNTSKTGAESKSSGSSALTKSVDRNGVVQNKDSTQAQTLESQTKDTCNSVVSSSSHTTNETVTSSTECGSKSQQEVTKDS